MLIFAEKNDRNKEEKRKMKRIISILLYIAILLPLAAQPPKHEVRAAWITAVYGLDWPQTRATSPESIRKQQAELIEIYRYRLFLYFHRLPENRKFGKNKLQSGLSQILSKRDFLHWN